VKPSKIALCSEILYPCYGGAERHAYELSKRVRYSEIYTSQGDERATIVSRPTVAEPPRRNMANVLRYIVNLAVALRGSGCELVHANGHLSILPAFVSGRRFVATLHDLYLWDSCMMLGRQGVLFMLYEIAVCLMLRRAEHVMVVSTAMKRQLAGIFGLCSKRISVVPNSVDVGCIDSVPAPRRESKLLVFVGRLARQKNVGMLLKAMPKLPEYRLNIIGDGIERKALVKMANELGISDRVNFMGVLEDYSDVIREIKRAFAFVLPSRRESFGIVLLEAMACETPVITTPCAGPRDFIRHGENGLFARDEDEIAEMVKLLEE
jgi:glycosyltransferase involved in cell wall biosynthesis